MRKTLLSLLRCPACASVLRLEWAMLDTFDMWAPAYDQPQTMPTIRGWFDKARFKDIEVFHRGFYVGRGTKIER